MGKISFFDTNNDPKKKTIERVGKLTKANRFRQFLIRSNPTC